MDKHSLRRSLRIVWAVAAKDIVDALRNKTLLSIVLGVSVLIVSAQALPLLTGLSDRPAAIVYDAGDSTLLGALRRDPDVLVYVASSRHEFETTIGEGSGAEWGLVIPADMEQQAGAVVELEGYVVHWADRAAVSRHQAAFETQIGELLDRPVRIDSAGRVLYPQPDAEGRPHLLALSLVLAVTTVCVALVPYLLLEERESHTLDALLVSPATAGQVVMGKAIAGLIYGLLTAAVVLVFNLEWVVHGGLVALAALCCALLAVAWGLLMGSSLENSQQASIWMALPMIVLQVPVMLAPLSADWPVAVRVVLTWIPTVAVARIVGASLAATIPWGQVAVDLGVVLGCALLGYAAVAWRVRRSDRLS